MSLARRTAFPVLLWASLTWASASPADAVKPKFGPDARPIQQATEYLRAHPAPDYWAISPFYVPQETGSDCSVASIAMLLNALRGVPAQADEDLVTVRALPALVGSERWRTETAENGVGVTFAELKDMVALGLRKYGLEGYEVEAFKPPDASDASLAALKRILAENERSNRDIVLVYFNQGVLTGDWDGPHVSPIGAYDADAERVLVMDVDRRSYVPYWSPVAKLLESLLKPAPESFGPLAGETGGIVWVRPRGDAPPGSAGLPPPRPSASPESTGAMPGR